MKIVGIIAEFNPMHNGHKYLIEKAKQITGADVAICLMSGNFTQAGNIALKDKFTRAKIAIENGPGAIRTRDLWFRKPLLYPTELRSHTNII